METEKSPTAILPLSVAALEDHWDIIEKSATAPSWDLVWTGSSEEGREKQISQQAFILGGNELPDLRQYATDNVYVADSALKVVFLLLSTMVDPCSRRPKDDSRYTYRRL